jgi:hypothetical protein
MKPPWLPATILTLLWAAQPAPGVDLAKLARTIAKEPAYTGLGDDELYIALPGKQAATVIEKLTGIVNANRELEKYHRARATV